MIKLEEITIRNYRSIKELHLQLKNFLALVGHNNAGKSNCLRAIKWALSGEKPTIDDWHYNQNPEVEFTLSGITPETLNHLTEDSAKKTKTLAMASDGKVQLKYEAFKDGEKGNFRCYYFSSNHQWEPITGGISNSLRTILPNVFVIQAMTDSSEQTSKIKSGSLFSKLLADYFCSGLSETLKEEISAITKKISDDPGLSELSKNFNRTLSQYYNNFNASFTPELKEQDIYKTFHPEFTENGKKFDISDFGHGLQRSAEFAMLECVMSQSNKTNSSKSTVLLIDEPEIYQHPSIINRIRKNLCTLSENGYQIALTTHSPHIIKKEKILENTYIIYSDPANGTSIRNNNKNINFEDFNRTAQSIVLSLDQLSYIPFCDRVLLYEGSTETIIFNELIDDIFPDSSYKLCHFQTSGSKQLPYVSEILEYFGIPTYLLGDLDVIRPGKHPSNLSTTIECAQQFATKFFKSSLSSSNLEDNGWPKKSDSLKSSDAFATLHTAPNFKQMFEPLLHNMANEHLILWPLGDIEHTLYPNLTDSNKADKARCLIKEKNSLLPGLEPIYAWKTSIKKFGGNWNSLAQTLKIAIGDIATEKEIENLDKSLDPQ